MKKNSIKIWLFIIITLVTFSSCNYLDVVPDNVATLDNAFTLEVQAKKFLFTCYSFMPRNGDWNSDPAMFGGDEIWIQTDYGGSIFNIAKGFQNVVNPYGSQWSNLFQGIRDCNIFLANIGKVPDMTETEKRRWIAEVKFLKAYYHFYLIKMYGPIPLMKTSVPVNTSVGSAGVTRSPVDSCFNYVIELIDEATGDLPLTITKQATELGRITRVIALAFKAKVLVYEASPLFNGNTDEGGLMNPDGTQLFNQTFSKAKWDSAAVACKRAIDICQEAGMKLYYQNPNYQQYALSDTIATQLGIRNAVAEKWNSELIWGNTLTNTDVIQATATPHLSAANANNSHTRGELSPPLKIAEMFYTNHGVPITEDKTWDYADRYALSTAGSNSSLHIQLGYTTAKLHFNRGPRFYADLGFDGGIWYGNGHFDDKGDDLFTLMGKANQVNAGGGTYWGTVTGYFIKKLVNFQNPVDNINYSAVYYPWPIMRLGGLYLLYAEALNESQGPGPDVYRYIDLVRKRAGLPSVESAWSSYSISPDKYKSQQGMRAIIHQERLIELAFEGQRFWDLRRWKEAATILNEPIKSWDLSQKNAAGFYNPVILFNQTFGNKDYFWPIAERDLENNPKLMQNIGW
jgi:hypothetical protein